MLVKILLALGAIVLVILVLAAFQPSDFRVERSTIINAPAAIVFAQVNDFHRWERWSPWAKLDPEMKTTFAGPPAGVGAVYSWSGNSKVGEGKMTLLESRPTELIRIKLEFLKPFAATNTTEYSFKPQGGQTAVTWSMFGPQAFMAKIFGLFMSMDKMVGGDFEKGLAQLKAVAEAGGK